ncbi:MAG: hypothetical protein BTN85_0833 [Candidatus Methanohalarchaeum thermophilum]|uniref:DUF1059 domain-containing protein n=1 Tax=Methanohalarchaeum thermophilum TaxID=1903181 RepID=A0A1Q6DVG8_METT1|nr:MAG: hypothetical protein BTN85_0833 [Candidatus Methanohalarchaeum thermophilum]
MPLKLECPKCGDVCKANTEKDLLEIAEEHVKEEHPEMELDNKTVEDLKSMVKEV